MSGIGLLVVLIIFQNFDGLHDQALLERYGEMWNKYDFSSNVLQGVFAYLNRHWVGFNFT